MLVAYVSAAAFQAHPTYLDLDDLRSGDEVEGDQSAELTNLLLMASAWADGWCEQPLAAHQFIQRCETRTDRQGNLRIHPDHTPVLNVSSVAYGYTPTALTTISNPAVWDEDQRNLTIPLTSGGVWSGALQFGVPSGASRLFVQLTYTAGWVSTALTAGTSSGATSLTVADPTGVQPSGTYRIWEPGVEEIITVSGSYTPPTVTVPPAPTSVPLAAPTINAHTTGAELSGMPAEMRLAVTNYAVSQLLRPDTAAEDSYPDTRLASGTRQKDTRRDGSGLVAEAERLLDPYRRVR